LFVITVLAEEYGSLRNLHGGNKSKRFKHHTLQDDDLYARVCKSGDVAYIRVDGSLENKLPPSIDLQTKK
jgi:hypothetical protein